MLNPVPIVVRDLQSADLAPSGAIPINLFGDDFGGGSGGLPGPQGIPGPAGADGLPGDDGADGLPGADGLDGAPGAPGPQGDPGIEGQRGPAGQDGVQGPIGKTGADGTSIVIDGFVDTIGELPDLTGTHGNSGWRVLHRHDDGAHLFLERY